MVSQSSGFIGGGRMVRILLHGWMEAEGPPEETGGLNRVSGSTVYSFDRAGRVHHG